MSLNSRIERITLQVNAALRQKKSDILVLVIPCDSGKGWFIDVCNNYKTGEEDTALKERLNDCDTFDELTEALDGYATNVPNVRRSNKFVR